MKKWYELYPNAESLRSTLMEIRNAGGDKTRGPSGKRRADLVTPLLNAIVGKECQWTHGQCAHFFERLLYRYCDKRMRELLLATSGYGDEYSNITSASKRREAFVGSPKNVDSPYSEKDPNTLGKAENTYLGLIADKMWEEYKDGDLLKFTLSVFTEDDLLKLGLGNSSEGIVAEISEDGAHDSPIADSSIDAASDFSSKQIDQSEDNETDKNGDITPTSYQEQESMDSEGSIPVGLKKRKRHKRTLITAIICFAVIMLVTIGGIAYINNYDFTYTVNLRERYDENRTWQENLDHARIGDVVEFQLEFVNDRSILTSILMELSEKLSFSMDAYNVNIRFDLPDNLEYIEDSTVLYNASHQEGIGLTSNDIATSGVSIGNYAVNGNAYVRIRCRIVNHSLTPGQNQLTARASATVNSKVKEDSVSVWLTY